MAFTKLTFDAASSVIMQAKSYANQAKQDPNDPASVNLLLAIDHYFQAIALNQVQVINGLNDLLDRVDKIQQKLGK